MISARTSKLFRGVAILIVIASHYAEWMFVEPVHVRAREIIATWGPPGVDIFFLLSGYGLYKSAVRGERPEASPWFRRSGITPRFVLRRFFSVIVPYLVISALINFYSGVWRQAVSDDTLAGAVRTWLLASDFWYISVLFYIYIAFILCFRFGGRLRLPLTAAAVIIYTVWLTNTGHADFWELSNASFILGICAAAMENRYPEISRGKAFKAIIGIAGAAGFAIAFAGIERAGGSGVPESFGWELTMNIFFSVIIYFLAVIMPEWRGHILPALGEASLFIYLLHAVMFWALIFRFEGFSYAAAASITGAITLIAATAAGLLYNRLTAAVFSAVDKKKGAG